MGTVASFTSLSHCSHCSYIHRESRIKMANMLKILLISFVLLLSCMLNEGKGLGESCTKDSQCDGEAYCDTTNSNPAYRNICRSMKRPGFVFGRSVLPEDNKQK